MASGWTTSSSVGTRRMRLRTDPNCAKRMAPCTVVSARHCVEGSGMRSSRHGAMLRRNADLSHKAEAASVEANKVRGEACAAGRLGEAPHPSWLSVGLASGLARAGRCGLLSPPARAHARAPPSPRPLALGRPVAKRRAALAFANLMGDYKPDVQAACSRFPCPPRGRSRCPGGSFLRSCAVPTSVIASLAPRSHQGMEREMGLCSLAVSRQGKDP